MKQGTVSLGVSEVVPWSPFDSPPPRRNIHFHRWPKDPDPTKKHRIALLAGDGIDEEMLWRIAETLYGNLGSSFCVVFFPREVYSHFTEGTTTDEEAVLMHKFKTSFPLPQLDAREAEKFTVIDTVFKWGDKLYHLEQPVPVPVSP